jgi:effector-binding domain-containing protein
MARQLEIDVGVPVAAAIEGDGQVIPRMLPAGRYAELTHVGPPGELAEATGALLDWAAGQGLSWDMSPGEADQRWGSRLEVYLTDPARSPT